jgi:peptidoglycan/LPS O-acetylase OafA/YrhL
MLDTTTEVQSAAGERIAFIDGLRGVAITLVILYHAFVRYPNLVPFGDRFSGVPIFRFGWLGVELFFLISGFVIYMTLEKCLGFRDFMLRRWLRLFPAMLICSVFLFLTASAFPERPMGQPVARDLLPGLTFIDPYWFAKLLGSSQGAIEGSFWSLYVEVEFYAVAGLVYFLFGEMASVLILIGLFVFFVIANFGYLLGIDLSPLTDMMSNSAYFGWFAAGALYWRYFQKRKLKSLLTAIIVAASAALFTVSNPVGDLRAWWGDEAFVPAVLAAVSVVALFTAAIVNANMQKILSYPPLLFIGFASYPLYLLHENIVVSMIVKIGRLVPAMPPLLMPIVPISLVICSAWLVAKYVEPWVGGVIKAAISSRSNVSANESAFSVHAVGNIAVSEHADECRAGELRP